MFRLPLKRPNLALTLGVCLPLAACDLAGPRPGVAQRGPSAPVRAEAWIPRPDSGSFRVAYTPVRDSTFAQWQEDFRRARFLEDIASWLNDWVKLPHDVTLTFQECGESNAFYRPEDRTVILCFELVDELDQAFEKDDDREQAVNDALLFTTLHEVGHALVQTLGIPIAGREEDAVDQLAALILVDGSDDGDVAAINGVRGLPDDDAIDDNAFADEHALSSQRFYNVLCLVYGQDPDAYADWTKDGTLPGERAQRCPTEYEQTRASWNRLLGPYLRD